MKLKFSQLAKAVLCTAAMAVSALGSMTISASAADNINVNIVCKNDTTTVSNAEWSIYKVGERKEADFVLTGEFSDYPIDMSDFTDASKMQAVADTLDNYVKTDGITPVSTGKTDANGEVKLSADSVGLYLVSGKSFENTTAKFTPSPSLIEIDKDIVAEGQITVYTKFTYKEIPAGDSDYGVRKSWIVKEIDIPANYTVVTKSNDKLFLIENTYKSDSSSNTDSSSSTPDSSSSGSDSSSSTPDNIPQTGSLNWPVPVLIGGGVILIAAGWRVSRKEK